MSFSVDFVFLSSVMQEKQCGSVDSIGLLVVKGVLVCVLEEVSLLYVYTVPHERTYVYMLCVFFSSVSNK